MTDRTAPNSALKLILEIDYLSTLEELLHIESQKLERLQKIKKKLNFGHKVSHEEIDHLFPEICEQVNAFLETNEPASPYKLLKPRLSKKETTLTAILTTAFLGSTVIPALTDQEINPLVYIPSGTILLIQAWLTYVESKHTRYHPPTKQAILGDLKRTDLIPSAAHEFTHHIQHPNKFFTNLIIKEGHARGVQKHIAKQYQEQEDNEAFLYTILNYNVGEFKSTYQWICDQLKRPPNKTLLKTKTNRDADENLHRLLYKEPTPHATGNTILSIYEAQKGKEIYKQMIDGTFQFT